MKEGKTLINNNKNETTSGKKGIELKEQGGDKRGKGERREGKRRVYFKMHKDRVEQI